jgi:pyruvate dehydrogenase (quinone)
MLLAWRLHRSILPVDRDERVAGQRISEHQVFASIFFPSAKGSAKCRSFVPLVVLCSPLRAGASLTGGVIRMANTTSDLLVERLIDWGVDTIFGFPGDGVNGIFEALRTHQDELKFIQVRHEEAAAFAACGYAKYTGRLGVCIATSGPGGIHLLNGLYDAKCDGQPVLAITGHTFHDLIGTHYQQDVDLDKLYMDVAAFNQRVMGPAHVRNLVDEAIKTAVSLRTVAHITIPKDIQELTTSE